MAVWLDSVAAAIGDFVVGFFQLEILVPAWVLLASVFSGAALCCAGVLIASAMQKHKHQSVPIGGTDIADAPASPNSSTSPISPTAAPVPILTLGITAAQHAELLRRVAAREMYRAVEAAILLHVSVKDINAMMQSGKLKSVLIDNERWIDSRLLLGIVGNCPSAVPTKPKKQR